MKRFLERLTTMLVCLMVVPFLADLQTAFEYGKPRMAYAKGNGGGGGEGEGGGGDSSDGGRGGARGAERVGYRGSHGGPADGRGEGRSQGDGGGPGSGHDHAGRGVGGSATGRDLHPVANPDRGRQENRGAEAGGRGLALRVREVQERYREAEAEDRELGKIAKTGVPR